MIRFRYIGLISILVLVLFQNARGQNKDIALIGQGVKALTDVMIHDITSPPVASRSYVYSFIAFYEAARNADTGYKSFAGQVNGLTPAPEPEPGQQYDWLLSGFTAFHRSAYAFAFSKELFQGYWDSIDIQIRNRQIPPSVYDRSVAYGNKVADHILQWTKGDKYMQTRSMPRFTAGRATGAWKQTPPDYMEAIEPHWNNIRPLTLEGPDQYTIPEPIKTDDPAFLAECKDVYEVTRKMTRKQIEIANFWDCNPFATQTFGHLMYSVKKLSPAGHWIGITGIAIRNTNQPFLAAIHSYSMVSIAMFDAIISAWDEKYRSNYIRPVTAIQQLISPVWQPLLQTPPFPEYPSGHSVISAAAAITLTHLYGDNFSYTDNVERAYGIPDRKFRSFNEAADEAAISRLYGGIHFREAIENGKDMGRKVGRHVIENVKLTK